MQVRIGQHNHECWLYELPVKFGHISRAKHRWKRHRQHCKNHQRPERFHTIHHRACKRKAQITIARITQIKAQRAHHQPRCRHRHQQRNPRRVMRIDFTGKPLRNKRTPGDQSPAQDRPRLGVILKVHACHSCVTQEKAPLTNSRPLRPTSERGERQKSVANPDAKVFTGLSDESKCTNDFAHVRSRCQREQIALTSFWSLLRCCVIVGQDRRGGIRLFFPFLQAPVASQLYCNTTRKRHQSARRVPCRLAKCQSSTSSMIANH